MALAFDSTAQSSTAVTGATSLTYAHTCTGSNLLLTVAVSWSTAATMSVTYNGVAMTSVKKITNGATAIEMFVLANPATGANNVVVTASASTTFTSGSSSYTGANPGNVADNTASNTATTATSVTTSITPNAKQSFVVNGVSTGGAINPTAGGGQTKDWGANIVGTTNPGSGGHQGPTDVGVSPSWSTALVNTWSMVAISIAPLLTVSISDTITTSEFSKVDMFILAVSDTATLSESVTPMLQSFINVNDSITTTDTPNIALVNAPHAADTATLSESITMLEDCNPNVSDNLTFTESNQRQTISFVAVSDTATTSESQGLTLVSFVGVLDNATLSEATNQLLILLPNKSETITTSENWLVGIGPIEFDNAASSVQISPVAVPATFAFTINGTDNPALFVMVALTALTNSVSGITWQVGANPAQNLSSFSTKNGTVGRIELWKLTNPTVGTGTISATVSAGATLTISAASYTGVDQSTPLEAANTANGTGGTASVSVTTVQDDDWVIAVISGSTASGTYTAGANQNKRTGSSESLITSALSDRKTITPPAAQSMSFTGIGSLDTWQLIGAGIRPAQPPGAALNVNKSDTLTTSESTNATLVHNANASDTLTTDEAVTTLAIANINVSDTITTSENMQRVLVGLVSVSDMMLSAEATTISLLISPSLSDTLTLSETVLTTGTAFVNTSDNLTLSENRSVFSPLLVSSASDTMTITEAILLIDVEGIGGLDSLLLSENIGLLIPVLFLSTSDNLTLTEQTTQLLLSTVNTSDTITTSELTTPSLLLFVNQNDMVLQAEVIGAVVTPTFISVSDSLTLTDDIRHPSPNIPGYTFLLAFNDSIVVDERVAGIRESGDPWEIPDRSKAWANKQGTAI